VKILVTGGAGYIGSIVSAMLVDAGHTVVAIDDLSTSDASGIPAGVEFVECHISDVARVLTPDAGFEAVLHFAGLIAAGESVQKPGLYWHVNTGGSLSLLVAMRAAGVRKIVFSSSAAVYGNPTEVPILETAAVAPTSPYGENKLAVDFMLSGEVADLGIAATSLRYFNVVGAYRHGDNVMGERHTPETHLIPLALETAAGRRDELAIFGTDYPTPDGTTIRDYIHVEDLARAHLLALDNLTPGQHKIFNLGNGTGFSIREVLAVVEKVTGKRLPVVEKDRRAGDPAELVASSEAAKAELGWVPAKASLEAMVSDAWEFLTAGGEA
jgi:UDP-glucose 4-epimerase